MGSGVGCLFLEGDDAKEGVSRFSFSRGWHKQNFFLVTKPALKIKLRVLLSEVALGVKKLSKLSSDLP